MHRVQPWHDFGWSSCLLGCVYQRCPSLQLDNERKILERDLFTVAALFRPWAVFPVLTELSRFDIFGVCEI